MRLRPVLLLAAMTLLSGTVHAQTPAPSSSPKTKGYAEFVAHSAFGNASGQSYGAEGGFTVAKNVQVFALFGHTSNVAPAIFGDNALVIATYLQQTQAATVSFTAEEPVTFGVGGVKYVISITGSNVEPYVLGGAGVASVSPNARFVVGGSDITANIASYGVVLGTDLSGGFTKPMIDAGGGVAWPIWKNVSLDFQYRFGRIFNGTSGITTQLAGAGLKLGF